MIRKKYKFKESRNIESDKKYKSNKQRNTHKIFIDSRKYNPTMSSKDSQNPGRKKQKKEVKKEESIKKEDNVNTEEAKPEMVPTAVSEEQERLRRNEMVNRAEQLITSISRKRAEVGQLMMMIMTLTMLMQLEALVEGAAGKTDDSETLHRWVNAECH